MGVNANNFQYNGKEKINSFNLNYSDYGFRTYDFLTNRFISVDPLTESFAHNGVYNYAENAPIMNVDLDGLEKLKSISPDGKPEYESGLDRPKTQIINVTSPTSQNSSSRGFFQDVTDIFSFNNGIQIYGSGGVKNSDDFGSKRSVKGKIVTMDLSRQNSIYAMVTIFGATAGKSPGYGGLTAAMLDEITDKHPILTDDSFERVSESSRGLWRLKDWNVDTDKEGNKIINYNKDHNIFVPYTTYSTNLMNTHMVSKRLLGSKY